MPFDFYMCPAAPCHRNIAPSAPVCEQEYSYRIHCRRRAAAPLEAETEAGISRVIPAITSEAEAGISLVVHSEALTADKKNV